MPVNTLISSVNFYAREYSGFENVRVLNFASRTVFEKCSRAKKKITGETFENVHGRFSRVTQYFWICSREGKKFHVRFLCVCVRLCVCVCVFLCLCVCVGGGVRTSALGRVR